MVSKKPGKGKVGAAKREKPALQNLTPKKEDLPKWASAFLAALEETGNISASCKSADISRPTAYELKEKSDEFAALWKDALEVATDALELEARRRAKDGVSKTVFYRDVPIATEHQYSDTLLIFLLKAHKPSIYRDKIEVKHDLSKLSDEELKQLESLASKLT